jgi:hypothetical protein
MISVFNNYCLDHLSSKDEDIDFDYYSQIEDQRSEAKHNQKKDEKILVTIVLFCFKYALIFLFMPIYLLNQRKLFDDN